MPRDKDPKPGVWEDRAWWAKQLGHSVDDRELPGEDASATLASEELSEELVAALNGAQAVADAMLAEVRHLAKS